MASWVTAIAFGVHSIQQAAPAANVFNGRAPAALGVDALAVETENRCQVSPFPCRQDVVQQAVQHQRLITRIRVIAQNHMRNTGSANVGTDIDQPQLFRAHPEIQQGKILADDEILAIPGALGQGLDGSGPVIGLVSDRTIIGLAQAVIPECVDAPQLFGLGLPLRLRKGLLPRLDGTACPGTMMLARMGNQFGGLFGQYGPAVPAGGHGHAQRQCAHLRYRCARCHGCCRDGH